MEVEKDSCPHPQLIFRIPSQFTVNFSTALDLAVPLINYSVWFHFKNGNYVLYDHYKKKIVKQGVTLPNISKVTPLSETRILFYSEDDLEARILDLTSDAASMPNVYFMLPSHMALQKI